MHNNRNNRETVIIPQTIPTKSNRCIPNAYYIIKIMLLINGETFNKRSAEVAAPIFQVL